LVVDSRVQLARLLMALPFLAAAFVLIVAAAMAIAGKCIVTVRDDEGTVFVGVGRLGWTRRFRPSAVDAVVDAKGPRLGRPRRPIDVIALQGATPLKFGGWLTAPRHAFVRDALRFLLRSQ
jgi:hypothetical protein